MMCKKGPFGQTNQNKKQWDDNGAAKRSTNDVKKRTSR